MNLDTAPLAGTDIGTATRSLLAVFVVLALVALCAWLVRRGAFGVLGRKGPSAVHVESAVPLGDRRSLLLVSVEGRRLLLGLTQQQVTLVTELAPGGPAQRLAPTPVDGGPAPTADSGPGSSFLDALKRAVGAGGGPAATGRRS